MTLRKGRERGGKEGGQEGRCAPGRRGRAGRRAKEGEEVGRRGSRYRPSIRTKEEGKEAREEGERALGARRECRGQSGG